MEIKPTKPDPLESEKCGILAELKKASVCLIFGQPWPDEHTCHVWPAYKNRLVDCVLTQSIQWDGANIYYGGLTLIRDQRQDREGTAVIDMLPWGTNWRRGEKPCQFAIGDITKAFKAARSARFEFSEHS